MSFLWCTWLCYSRWLLSVIKETCSFIVVSHFINYYNIVWCFKQSVKLFWNNFSHQTIFQYSRCFTFLFEFFQSFLVNINIAWFWFCLSEIPLEKIKIRKCCVVCSNGTFNFKAEKRYSFGLWLTSSIDTMQHATYCNRIQLCMLIQIRMNSCNRLTDTKDCYPHINNICNMFEMNKLDYIIISIC